MEMTKLKAKRDENYIKSEHLDQLQTMYASLIEIVDKDGNPDVERQLSLVKTKFAWLSNKKTGKLQQRLFHIMAPDIYNLVLEVKESGLKDAGKGLFACTSFEKGDIITVYIGVVVGIENDSEYSVTNGGIVRDCKPWMEGNPYLAAHMRNNLDYGSKCKSTKNAKIGPRFEILATRAINPGDMILLNYNSVQI